MSVVCKGRNPSGLDCELDGRLTLTCKIEKESFSCDLWNTW
jgi:hypothetical protein